MDSDYTELRKSWIGEKNAYLSTLLTSGRPKFIPFWIYYGFNAVMNCVVTFPLVLYLWSKGFNIINPGLHIWKMLKHFPVDAQQYNHDILHFWLTTIDKDVVLLVKGWRAEKSYGAQQEVGRAVEKGIPVVDWRGKVVDPLT